MDSRRIVILDYQAGNIRSVAKAIEKTAGNPIISGHPEDIEQADILIFPGQGSNDSAMRSLKNRGLVEPIKSFIKKGNPFLGICLGIQCLLESSEEGVEPGLGILAGSVKHLPHGIKIPHIGWNQVTFLQEHPVLEGIPQESHFYFVHSYYPDPLDPSLVLGTTSYNVNFCSVIASGNLIATLFHPEKSGALGLRFFENFFRFANSGGK